MTNAIKILVTFVLASMISSFALAASIVESDKTIILINGTPFYVEIEKDGQIIEKIVPVPSYFTSNESHASLVNKAASDYKAELPNIKSRLLIFPEERAILDNTAVDHIRDMARLYSKGYIQNVHITAAHIDNASDEALAAHRINSIYQMLKDFGVKDEGITADMKGYRSDLPNVFVQLKIE